MKKILISFGTRPLAQRVKRLLENRFIIFLSTSEEIPSILKNSFYAIPTASNPTFAHEVLKLALDLKIDFILPLGQPELLPFAESKILFEEYGIDILTPSKEELSNVFILENPSKEIELDLYLHGRSIINVNSSAINDFSGLGIVSDDHDEVALVLSK